MEKGWIKMQSIGLCLLIFVFWNYLTLYPYLLMTQPASDVIPMFKLILFHPHLKHMALPLRSVNTLGFETFTTGSRVLSYGLLFLRLLFCSLILISGFGLILKKKKALVITLYTALGFVVINGLSLILYSPTVFNAIRAYGGKAVPYLIDQLIVTLVFAMLAYYIARPGIKKLFSQQ